MNQKINEIEINGIKYVPLSEVQSPALDPKKTVLIRTRSAGVFMGEIIMSDLGKGLVDLANARRIWFWAGAASLSQLAIDGTSKPNECKFPAPLTTISLTEVIEVIPCTEKAVKSLTEVKIWKS